MVSEKGDQSFTFPSYSLAPGEEVKLTSGPSAGTGAFDMASGNIWNNSSLDPAALYNNKGV